MSDEPAKKVVFCTPVLERPFPQFVEALEASIGPVIEAGWDEGTVSEVNCPYISHARATMLRKALDAKADVIVFLDYDLAWEPGDLLRLIETPGDVVAGNYRYKNEPEGYMGRLFMGEDRKPIVREDGCIKAEWVPAGFLKITADCVHRFMAAYPELIYGPRFNPSVDLFNHGAHHGLWWGEDYAFSRRWNEIGGEVWIIPDLNLTHYAKGGTPYPGNFHQYLLRTTGKTD